MTKSNKLVKRVIRRGPSWVIRCNLNLATDLIDGVRLIRPDIKNWLQSYCSNTCVKIKVYDDKDSTYNHLWYYPYKVTRHDYCDLYFENKEETVAFVLAWDIV